MLSLYVDVCCMELPVYYELFDEELPALASPKALVKNADAWPHTLEPLHPCRKGQRWDL